jgi:hypothetical protein
VKGTCQTEAGSETSFALMALSATSTGFAKLNKQPCLPRTLASASSPV